jgi:HSP20 family protein
MVFRYRNRRQPVYQFRDDMDRMLGGMLGPWAAAEWPAWGRRQPAVNMWEAGDAVLVELEVPGLTSQQIDISVVGDQLSLKIDCPDLQQEGVTYHRRERPVGEFRRVLRLPVEVDSNRVEAELRQGVLTITLQKAETAKPRKIQVSPAS